MNTPKLIAIFLAVFAITSYADTAAQLVTTINSYSTGVGTGSLSAVDSGGGSFVIVSGTKTGATSTLTLNIDAGVRVVWRASLTGSAAAQLISKSGTGSFEVQSNGKVDQTGDGYAIYVNGGDVTSGGTVSSTGSGSSIYNRSTGTITISGGTVSATTGRAVYNRSTGKITVSGTTTRITSANTDPQYGTLCIEDSDTATAERLVITGGTVENTANNGNANAVRNGSYGAVTISGGKVSVTGGRAVSNNGTVNISGGEVSATTGDAVVNSSPGTVNINGGEVNATTGSAVYSSSTGTVSISGGTVTSNNYTVRNQSTGTVSISGGKVSTIGNYYSIAVLNASTGAVSISGGTVSATTGKAVNNSSTGKITVSGTATVTSANTTAASGTIEISGNDTATAERLVITGGKVENTAASANARAIYNASTGAVSISGGAVSATTGRAVHNNSTGTVIVIGGTVTGGTKYFNNVNGGTIIEWTKTAPQTYTELTSNDLTLITPTDATAKWQKDGSKAGIGYANGVKTGFAEVPGVTVKIHGLENTAPPTREVSASNTQTHTYDLNTLAFNNGDHGALSFQLGAFTGDTEILTAKPTIGSDGHTLTYTGTGKTSGNATLEIIVTSDYYADITTTIIFEATPKQEVAITNITIQNYVYDGTPKSGYTGTPASGAYTGALLYQYAGTGIDGITTDKPKNAGEYTLKISLPPEAPYVGVWSDDFTISKKQIAKPTAATNLVHTGSEQSAIAENAAYTVTGGKGTNVSTYTATVALKDKANYEWADGTTDDLSLPWEIKANTPILPQIATGSIRVQATANAIVLENLPRNTKVQIYSLQGKQIYSANSENSQILRIVVQTKGMYIVKAGNQTVRVAVR